jgi:serine/threonine protein kinase
VFRSGQKVGEYTLIEKLGRGGFGEVWLAEKRSQFVTKKVAVKLPHEEQVNFDAIAQEATLWEQASGHPNVLPIIDADVYDGQVVIVSEYADGGSLADKLKREEKLPVQQAVEMTIGILNGLEFLHNRKIIHRDIKPQNILLQGNTPRLADFGISRAMNTTIVSSAIIGTDAYMSPESLDGKRNAQTDIWSVGVVLYQLLKGNLPFPQENISERMFAILTKEFEPLPADVPQRIRDIVGKALTKKPADRYQTCTEMIGDLRKALNFIENPTFAPTEILHIPLNTETVTDSTAGENKYETVESEKETIQKQTPFNQPAAGAFQPEPAPTEPAFQQHSIVTELRQASTVESQPVKFKSESKSAQVIGVFNRLSEYKGLIIAFVPFLLLVGIVLILSLSEKGCSTTSTNTNSNKSNAKKLQIFSTNANKWGFMDENNKIVIPAKYEIGSSFSEGLAAVSLNGKYGFIDEKDNVVIPFKYADATPFLNGYAMVSLEKEIYISRSWNAAIKDYKTVVLRVDKFGNETEIPHSNTIGNGNVAIVTPNTTNTFNANKLNTNTASNVNVASANTMKTP